jgi:hypothetical protein
MKREKIKWTRRGPVRKFEHGYYLEPEKCSLAWVFRKKIYELTLGCKHDCSRGRMVQGDAPVFILNARVHALAFRLKTAMSKTGNG